MLVFWWIRRACGIHSWPHIPYDGGLMVMVMMGLKRLFRMDPWPWPLAASVADW